MSRRWAQKKSGSNSSMPVQKSSSWQRPSSDPIYDAPAPKQTASVQTKRPFDWSRVTVEAQSPAAVQAKLTVGSPGDKYEQEADAMANKVMTMPAPEKEKPIESEAAPEENKPEEVQTKPLADAITPLVQREMSPEENKPEEVQTKPLADNIQRETAPEENKEEEVQAKSLSGSIQRETAPEENKEEEVQAKSLPGNIQRETAPEENEVQTKPVVGSIQRETASEENKEEEVQAKPAPEGNSQTSSNVESQLSASKGGGSPLSDEVRAFMEPRFGADFNGVRVHTDGAAVQMNRELGAQAFTHGSDIYFGSGKTAGNNDLTAHELTHVVQQTGALQLKGKTGSAPSTSATTVPRTLPFITMKRKHISLTGSDKYGHWWTEIDGSESYGWWPKYPIRPGVKGIKDTLLGVDGELNGVTSFGGSATLDPHHGDAAPDTFHPVLTVPKSNAAVKSDIRSFASSYSGEWRWTFGFGQNCHTFQEKLMKTVGLKEP